MYLVLVEVHFLVRQIFSHHKQHQLAALTFLVLLQQPVKLPKLLDHRSPLHPVLVLNQHSAVIQLSVVGKITVIIYDCFTLTPLIQQDLHYSMFRFKLVNKIKAAYSQVQRHQFCHLHQHQASHLEVAIQHRVVPLEGQFNLIRIHRVNLQAEVCFQ